MTKYFSSFLRFSMIIVIFLISCFTTITSISYIGFPNRIKLLIFAIAFISFLVFVNIKDLFNIRSRITNLFEKNILVHILILAFALRLLWVLLVPTKPTSDFALMYNSAASVAQGNYTDFHGTSYFARFAHNTIAILYYSIFYNFTNNPLFILKILNVFFQTLAVFAMYLLINELYKDKKIARYGAFFMAIFPPFIMYCSQVVSENMAIPFYIFSIYYFFKSLHTEKSYLFPILAGILLSIGNLFRMVGAVFVIAYLMYTLFYMGYKNLVKKGIPLVMGFILPLYLISTILLSNNITDTQLWKSKEPYHTSILKGTNIEALGRWNPEDAVLPDKYNYDPELVKEASKNIIKERLTSTPINALIPFYVKKLVFQWGMGDYGAYGWTVPVSDSNTITNFLNSNSLLVMIICNIMLLIVLLRILKKTINKNSVKDFDYFFIILFAGYVLLYLITEMQSRYSFIVCWLFLPISLSYSSKEKDLNRAETID